MREHGAMRRAVKLSFVGCVLSLWPVVMGSSRASDETVPVELQTYLKAAHEVQQFGGAVLVARGDRVLLRQGYGYANHELKVPNAANTRFRIASVSKYFTAIMVLALEEQGKLHLSDPIAKYLPDLPGAWREVSIQQLLSHTSGIPNYTDTEEFKLKLGQPASPQTIVGLVKDQPIKPTGESGAYSNTGYVLLGMLIEATAKRSYDDSLQQLVCQPAGMRDTGCDHLRSLITNRASGYVRAVHTSSQTFSRNPINPPGLLKKSNLQADDSRLSRIL